MKNYQKGFIVPLVWGIVALLAAGLGTYIYQNQHLKVVPQTNQVENTRTITSDSSTNNQEASTFNLNDTSENKTSTSIKLSEESILNAINSNGGCKAKDGDSFNFKKMKDYYSCENKNAGFSHDIGEFAYGDLNNDGYEDAIAVFTTCGASCGNNLIAVINQKNGSAKVVDLTVPGYLSSGAGQTGVENISIKNSVISIKAFGWEGSDRSNDESRGSDIKDFRFDGNNLVEIKDSTDNQIAPDHKTYVNQKFGFKFEYPSEWILNPDPSLNKNPDSDVDFITPNKQKIYILTRKTADTAEAGSPSCDTIKPYGYKIYTDKTDTIGHYKVRYFQELIPGNHGYATTLSKLCIYENPQILFEVSITDDASLKNAYTEDQEVKILNNIFTSLGFAQ